MVFGQDVSNFEYGIKNGTITINGYWGSETEVRIPAVINGIRVTTIDLEAFRGKQLISVTIPNTVTTIGVNAFSQNQLTVVTIPDSVQTIKDCAFGGNQLKSIIIPNNVNSIGECAFWFNQLTSVIIGNGVKTIDEDAFAYNQLISITIGANVNISSSAFNDGTVSEDGILYGRNIRSSGFETAYNNGGKLAGTYKRANINSTTWTRQ
jgi:hypothetical protein